MSALADAAALLLAAVLVVAAAAKLRRSATTAASFTTIGLPLPGLLSKIVPAAEVVAAAALLMAPSIGGPVAFGLLAAFTVALRRAAAAGVPCACFGGSTMAEPPSAVALARNAGLLLAAAVASAGGHANRPELAALLAASTATLLAMIGLALWELRLGIGRLWSNTLAGETGGEVVQVP